MVWDSTGQDGSNSGVFGQRFNRAAERVGSEFQVNAFTTGNQAAPSAVFEATGDFFVVWNTEVQDGDGFGIFGQRFARDGSRVGSEFRLNLTTASSQYFPAIADTGRGLAAVWVSDDQDGFNEGIAGRRQEYVPAGLVVDADDAGSSDANGILESGETVVVEPAWENETSTFNFFAGTAASFSGPAGGAYAISDAAALYGIPASASAGCNDGSPNACYRVGVSGTRPATHWDAMLRENLSGGGSQFWTLHVGDSFADVSHSHPFYKKIETLLHHGITSGCTTTAYCPVHRSRPRPDGDLRREGDRRNRGGRAGDR